MKTVRHLVTLVFLLSHIFTIAQCDLLSASKEVYQWRFFQNSGLDFNNMVGGKPTFVASELTGTPGEGSASIADEDGNLIFYTDGIDVYDGNDDIVVNGTGLLGDPSATSSAIILPHPSNPDRYYIATVQEGDDGPLHYSEFDRTIGATGGIVAGSKNTLVTSFNIYEKVGAVAHANGSDTWVIVTESETNNYHAIHFGENGIVESVVNTVGPSFADYDDDFGKGYIKPSVDGSQLVIASADEDPRGFVEVFQFDDETGVISSYPTPKRAYLNAAYGVEISPNGRYLYVSQRDKFDAGEEKGVFQYDLEAADFAASETRIGTLAQGGALQIGPDGVIYASQATYGYLATIDTPNEQGSASNFVRNGVYLNGNDSGEGLPTFVTSFFNQSVDAGPAQHICEGETVTLGGAPTAQGGAEPYTYSWSPTTGLAQSNISHPTATPTTTTTYVVTVTDNLGCQNSDKVKITVNPRPIVDAGNDITTCLGGLVNLGGNPSATGASNELTYNWTPSNGLDADFISNPQLTVSTAGIYTLTVTDSLGCESKDEVEIITEERITLDATITPTTCSRDEGNIELITGGPSTGPFSYEWQNPTLEELTFLMDDNKEFEANFVPTNPTYTLNISTIGLGNVFVEPKGYQYNPGETVTVTAMPYNNYFLNNWSGDLSGTTYQQTIVMDSDKSITADFTTTIATDSFRVEAEGPQWNFNDRLDEGCNDEYRTYGSGTDYVESGVASGGETAYPTGGDWRALWWVYDGPVGSYDLNLRWHDRNSEADERSEVIFQIGRRGGSCIFPPANNGNYKVYDNWNTGDYAQGWHINSYKNVNLSTGDSIIIYQNRESSQGVALIDYIDFIESPVQLTTNTIGSGEIIQRPSGNFFPYNTEVDLYAKPAPGWIFNTFRDGISTPIQSAKIYTTRDMNIEAEFTPVSSGNYTLHTYSTGKGDVESSPNQEVIGQGEKVSINAKPETDYEFLSWTTNVTRMDSLAAGDYIITAMDVDGCTIQQTFTVDVITAPIPISLQEADPICEGDTLKLLGNEPGNQQEAYWYIDGVAFDSLTYETEIADLSSGTYEIIYEIKHDVCGEASDTITVEVAPSPVANILGSDRGDTLTTANNQYGFTRNIVSGAFNGEWGFIDFNNSGATTSETANTLNVQNLASESIVQISWSVQDTAGVCPASIDSIFLIRRQGTIPDAGPDSTICISDLPFTRTGNGDETDAVFETYRWIDNSGNANTSVDNEISIPQSFSAGSYAFVFEIEHSVAGLKTDTFRLTIVEPTIADIININTADTVQTPFTTYGVSHEAISPAYSGKWTINDYSASGVTSSESGNDLVIDNLIADDLVEISWQVTDTDNVCPASKDSIFIVRKENTIPVAGPDTIICISDLPFTRLGNGDDTDPLLESYSWIDPSGIADLSTNNALTLPSTSEAGVYAFTFQITHTETGQLTDAFTVRIVNEPVANISGYSYNEEIITPDETYELEADDNGDNYSWNLFDPNNASSLTSSTDELNAIINDLSVDNTVLIMLTAQDEFDVCPISKDSVQITRRTITIAEVENDTICYVSDVLQTVSPMSFPDASIGEEATWTAQNTLANNSNSTSSGNDLQFTIAEKGIYKFEYTISNPTVLDGNDDPISSSATLYIVVDEGPVNVNAGNDTTICTTSYQLNASSHPDFNTTWETSNTALSFSSQTDNLATVNDISGTVNLTWTVSSKLNVCPAVSDQVAITSTGDLTIPDAGINQTICITSQPVNLDGISPKTSESVTWEGSSNLIFSSQNQASTTVEDLGLGENQITYTIDNGVCDPVSDEIIITVIDTPSITIQASDTAVCSENDMILLTASGSAGIGKWYKNDTLVSEFAYDGNDELTLRESSNSGTYTFEVEPNICPATQSNAVPITIYSKPIATLESNFVIYEGEEFVLTGNSSSENFRWLEAPNLYPNSTLPTATVSGQPEGAANYYFVAVNGLCEDTASVVGTVRLPIVIPEVFSPNGDGIYDFWEITGLDYYPNVKVKVFNRWGSKVFQSEGTYEQWDGSFNGGNQVATGTYFYVVELDEDNSLNGNVTVMR